MAAQAPNSYAIMEENLAIINGKSPYKILKLSPHASDDEINRGCRMALSRYHPDNKATANRRYFAIAQAVSNILRDPMVRTEYNLISKKRGLDDWSKPSEPKIDQPASEAEAVASKAGLPVVEIKEPVSKVGINHPLSTEVIEPTKEEVIPPVQSNRAANSAAGAPIPNGKPINMGGNGGVFNDHDDRSNKSGINKALVALLALAGAALLYMSLAPKSDTAPVKGADEAASKADTNANKGKDTNLPDDIKAELVRIAGTANMLQPTITSPDESKPTVQLSYDYTPYSDKILSMKATLRPYDYSPREGNFISSKVTIAFKDAAGKLRTDTVAMCISEPDTQAAIRASERMQEAINKLPNSNLRLVNCNDGSK